MSQNSSNISHDFSIGNDITNRKLVNNKIYQIYQNKIYQYNK